MRFALLCHDPLANPLVEALGRRIDGHQLSDAVRMKPPEGTQLSLPAALRLVDHWEELLIAKDTDAVLIGGDDLLILEGAKQLATSGAALLFFPQASQGSTFIYELSLIRDDNRVELFPVFWHRFDAAVNHLKQELGEGRLGRVQFLQLQRTLSRTSASTPLTQAEVDAELLPDADLLRWLIGDYDQVTALKTAATTEGVLMENVVLAGRSLPEANWSISPAASTGWRLTVRGEHGIAELFRDEVLPRWICDINGERIEGDERSTAGEILSAFEAEVSNGSQEDGSSPVATGRDWGDLVKCFETVDATHRSVRRRRTIELHFEPMSERAIFKTQMTAIGCGLLIATFFMTLCFLGIASVVPLPSWVLIGLRVLVFAPLVIFLIAQVLLPLTRPSSNERIASP